MDRLNGQAQQWHALCMQCNAASAPVDSKTICLSGTAKTSMGIMRKTKRCAIDFEVHTGSKSGPHPCLDTPRIGRDRKMKKAIKWLMKRWGYSIEKVPSEPPSPRPPPPLTDTQEKFIEWNAGRLGISREASKQRFMESAAAFPGGHGGHAYKEFCDLSYKIFGVLYGDTEAEIFFSYPFYGPLHMLRFLSYPDRNIYTEKTDFVEMLKERAEIVILDFGCGLAHESRGIAHAFRELNKPCRLLLADIPTIRKEFVLWLCRQEGIEASFFDCRAETPIPAFPKYDFLIATEVFEHVYDPVKYFEALNANLNPGGLILTNVSNHHREFMHVSPNLEKLRVHMKAAGFREIRDHALFQKPR